MTTLWCVQHEERVAPGAVERWAAQRSVSMTLVRADRGDRFPTLGPGDVAVVLGGSMNVDDSATHGWLGAERDWISALLDRDDVAMLGICLGAQQLASVLGADVHRAPQPERGWRTIMGAGDQHLIPPSVEVFQTHGQVFELPDGARRLAHNDAWHTQAFIWNKRAIAVQFHPEFTDAMIVDLAGRPTSWSGPFVHAPSTWFDGAPDRTQRQHALLFSLLDQLADAAAQ